MVIIGAGPAGLAAALRLAELLRQAHAQAPQPNLPAPQDICVLEKGKDVGAHLLSGAILDPISLEELLPSCRTELAGVPWATPVSHETVHFLTENSQWRFPIPPPFLRNRGYYIVSLNRLGKWLAAKVEAAGATIFAGFAGKELLFENGTVVGVQTEDKGIDRAGQPKANFQPGHRIRARLTILCEGSRGSLTKQLIARKQLDQGCNPQLYALGLKELWEIHPQRLEPGNVVHTFGWPLPLNQCGGGWLYGMPGGRISLGLVVSLQYTDPTFDPYQAFQLWKTHPFLRRILAGGRLLAFGAKTIPGGGWFALPALATDGALLAGDAAGFVNSLRLKGIHLAIKTGMLAAETAFAALKNNQFSSEQLSAYSRRVEESWIKSEMWKARNHHQVFRNGLLVGSLHFALQMLTGGRGLHRRYPAVPGHRRLLKLTEADFSARPRSTPAAPDNALTFDKLTSVYFSGTRHEENQPCHLLIEDRNLCNTRCVAEYGNPCQHFCPAAVYEMVESTSGSKQLRLNPSNCVHCKTCDIMDPYQIITWVPPEGGGGPNYENL